MPDEELDRLVGSYAHAVLVGPGLGPGAESRAFVERLLTRWQGPVVVDADALNVFAGDIPGLAALLDGRPAVITPHPAELARLIGSTVDALLAARFEAGREVARALRAVVLLKGMPTVVSAPNGAGLVSATGTPALAAAGSGDVLGGVAATLLAQTGEALVSAAAAAWVHGRAAELANAGRPARGITLDDVLGRLSDVWAFSGRAPQPPLLGELPRVGDPP